MSISRTDGDSGMPSRDQNLPSHLSFDPTSSDRVWPSFLTPSKFARSRRGSQLRIDQKPIFRAHPFKLFLRTPTLFHSALFLFEAIWKNGRGEIFGLPRRTKNGRTVNELCVYISREETFDTPSRLASDEMWLCFLSEISPRHLKSRNASTICCRPAR